MAELTHLDTLKFVEELKRRFPKLKLHNKRPWWLKTAFLVLSKITKQSYSDYTQTIGMNIYLPLNWTERNPISPMRTLRHEAVHLKQFRKLTIPLMIFIYLFPILPMGLALGRALLEREAYNEGIRAAVEYLGASENLRRSLKKRYLEALCGPSYGWAWPFPEAVSMWFEKAYQAACSEQLN